MKQTIPETGTVISLKGDTAIILLKGGRLLQGLRCREDRPLQVRPLQARRQFNDATCG